MIGGNKSAQGSDARILLVEDSFALAETYNAYLKSEGCEITSVETGQAAMDVISADPPDVVVLDVHLPDMNGIEMLKELRERDIETDVIIITAQASVNLAVDAMREGAVDFIMKPFTADRLRVTVRNAMQRRKMAKHIEVMSEELSRDQFVSFIGKAPAMQAVYKTLQNAAQSDATCFVRGESGTGKELCAEALHKLSKRKNGPMITLNCAAIPHDLLESEIFGHVKGAFTGATRDRKGAAMQANGGTLFLDEICEMDLSLQSKLLRFLQERTVQPVGSDQTLPTDVRIVCATNRDPLGEVRAGRFREDLFYRLHVVPVLLPPLRDRGEDVVLIARHFLSEFAAMDDKQFDGFSADAEHAMMAYGWPGNVRQLQNVVRSVVVMNAGGRIEQNMLPDELRALGQTAGPATHSIMAMDDLHGVREPTRSFEAPTQSEYTARTAAREVITGNPVTDTLLASPHAPAFVAVQPEVSVQEYPAIAKPQNRNEIVPLDDVIRQTIETAIELCDGSIPKAARRLDVSPSTLYRRLQAWEAAEKGEGEAA